MDWEVNAEQQGQSPFHHPQARRRHRAKETSNSGYGEYPRRHRDPEKRWCGHAQHNGVPRDAAQEPKQRSDSQLPWQVTLL